MLQFDGLRFVEHVPVRVWRGGPLGRRSVISTRSLVGVRRAPGGFDGKDRIKAFSTVHNQLGLPQKGRATWSCLSPTCALFAHMQTIIVKTVEGGETITLEVKPSDDIASVKSQIYASSLLAPFCRYEPEDVRLFFAGSMCGTVLSYSQVDSCLSVQTDSLSVICDRP